jgi:phenylacetate-CoA ligase
VWGNPPVAVSLKQKLRLHCLDRQIYLDTMALNPQSMGAFVDRWRRLGPKGIFGHSHSIYMFACYLRDNGIDDLRPRSIVSTSMMLLAQERVVIEEAFDCKVTNRYGCEEVGLIACECEQHQGMHLNTLQLFVEVVDDHGVPVQPGMPGKLLLTDLNNRGMPLLRYQVEDVGAISARICDCGRGLPMLERIEGRVADFLRAADGTLVAGVSLVERTLTRIPGIAQMQLIQEAVNSLEVRRVKAPQHTPATDAGLLSELRSALGSGMQILIRDVEGIDQEKNGKYRFSICRIR